jgi:hypothetical protein
MARRKAAHTGIRTGTIIVSVVLRPSERAIVDPYADKESLSILYIISAGATPKLTTSARLSSSLPISEYAFSNLAEKPSRKSNIIAATISHEAVTLSPLAAKIIAINPADRLREVIKLGICFIIK